MLRVEGRGLMVNGLGLKKSVEGRGIRVEGLRI